MGEFLKPLETTEGHFSLGRSTGNHDLCGVKSWGVLVCLDVKSRNLSFLVLSRQEPNNVYDFNSIIIDARAIEASFAC